MNFNYSRKPEYNLNAMLIDEVIRLYGIRVKFLNVEKVNYDPIVFGGYSHLKSNADGIFDLFALPEVSESFDISQFNFDEFGISSYDDLNLFVFAKTLNNICPMNEVVGKLIVLPNDKVMEITNIEWMVPGINNLFVYKDEKTVYKLFCVPYSFKLTDELANEHLINEFKDADARKTQKHPAQTLPDTEVDNAELDSKVFSDFLAKSFENDVTNITTDNMYDPLSGLIDQLQKEKKEYKYMAELKDSASVVARGAIPRTDSELQKEIEDVATDTDVEDASETATNTDVADTSKVEEATTNTDVEDASETEDTVNHKITPPPVSKRNTQDKIYKRSLLSNKETDIWHGF